MEMLLTVEDVARMTGLNKRQVYDRVSRGEVSAIKIRNAIRFEPAEVERMVQESRNLQGHVTTTQAAEVLGVHAATVRDMIRTGELGATKVGREYRISPEDLADYYEANRSNPGSHDPSIPGTHEPMNLGTQDHRNPGHGALRAGGEAHLAS